MITVKIIPPKNAPVIIYGKSALRPFSTLGIKMMSTNAVLADGDEDAACELDDDEVDVDIIVVVRTNE